MTKVSRSLSELREVADGFGQCGIGDLAEEEDLVQAGLPSVYWPVMADGLGDVSSTYRDLLETAIEGARNLQGAVRAVGDALEAVAEHYEEQEEENESDAEGIEVD